MALKFNAIDQRVTRDGTYLDPALDWTIFQWFRWSPGTTTTDFRSLRVFDAAIHDYTGPYIWFGTWTGDTEDFGPYVYDGTNTFEMTPQPTLTIGQWYWTAITYKASTTTLKFYFNNTLVNTNAAADLSALNPFTLDIVGDNHEFTQTTEIAFERVWQRTLTLAELIKESQFTFAQQTTSLLSDCPLDSKADLAVRSGTADDFVSSSASITNVMGPFKAPGWTIRATSAIATGTVSLTITKPTGTIDGDIMVMSLAHKGAGYATMPAGWTLIRQGLSGATRGEMYWRRASGEGASYSVTGLATIARGGITSYIGGLAVGDVVAASSVVTAAASTATGPASIDPMVPRALLVGCIASGANEGTITWRGLASTTGIPGASEDETTGRFNSRAQSSAAGIALAEFDAIKVIPVATGDMYGQQLLGTTLSGEHVSIMAALIPEVAGSGTSAIYYLAKKYPEVRLIGPSDGGWDSTWDSPSGLDTEGIIPTLSRTKTDAGINFSEPFQRNSDDPWKILWRRCVSPPLAAQTIDGNVDVMFRVGVARNDTSVGNPVPTAKHALHIYIADGNDNLNVKHVLLNEFVDGTNWSGTFTVPKFQGLTAPQALTSGATAEGDRVVMEIGFQVTVPTPYPAPDRPPDQFMEAHFLSGACEGTFASSNYASVGLESGTAASTSTLAPFIIFSHDFAELTPTQDDTPANSTSATATVIAAAPFTETINTTQVLAADRQVWYSWTAPEDGRMYANAFASNYRVRVRIFNTFPIPNPPAAGFTGFPTEYITHQDRFGITALGYQAFDAVSGTTYYFQIRGYGIADGFNAQGTGGSLTFQLFKEIPLANNDVISVIRGYIVRYNQAGDIAAVSGDLASTTGSGLAIDYTKRSMDDLNGGTHVDNRLYVGIFGLDYVEILDLATLNLGEFEVDFLTDAIASANKNLSSLAINSTGMMSIGWFGNGFTFVGGGSTNSSNVSSFLQDSATLNSSDITFVDATFADDQAGSPYADATVRAAAVEAGGTNAIEYATDGETIYYTSSGFYFPVGGTLIKRYNMVAGTQSTDLGTVPAGSGVNPGVKGLFPLPDGSCLVCNGADIRRMSSGGVSIMTYTPTLDAAANAGLFFVDCEPTSDLTSFWALDGDRGILFKFDLETGAQLLSVETNLGVGACTSLVVVRLTPLVAEIPGETSPLTRLWKLYRMDMKISPQERA